MDAQHDVARPVHPGAGAHPDVRQMDNRIQEGIGHCSGCHNLCLDTVAHCLDLGGEYASRAHIGLLLDCARICATTGEFLLRGSPFQGQLCAVCADVCQRCAEACEQLGPDDEVMQHCALLARRCTAACRDLAAATM